MSVILIFIFTVLLLYFIQSKYKLYLVGSRIPGPWAVPLMGNVQMMTKLKPECLFLTVTEHRAKYRASYRLWLGPQLWVFLHSPAEARDALNDMTLVKPDTFKQLHALIGNGLLISHGKYWESHRRALGPAFHPSILNSFSSVISQHADELVKKLKNIKGKSVEVNDYLFPCILDTVINTSMGKNINSQNDARCTYILAFHKTSELLFKRMMNPLLAPDFIFKRTNIHRELKKYLSIIHKLLEEVIQQRMVFLSSVENAHSTSDICVQKRLTLLDTLLTTKVNGRPLTFREICDEVNTFVFAGVDTTTAAMAFILYALGKYPLEQSKLIAEMQSMHSSNNGASFPITINAINNLEYLDLFIKECLRLYTIVPMTGRQTTCDTIIGDRYYCAGITLWVNMYGLAHDPDLFDAPNEFRPQRFAKSEHEKFAPFSYIPFSGGSHICIGRKYALSILKILTVKLLQNFEILLSQPEEELVLMAQMVLKSLNGINVILKERSL